MIGLPTLRKPFVVLLTIPAGTALTIGALPFLIIYLEDLFGVGDVALQAFPFDTQSARTVLSVIATGAMSALSLAYSLVLVVFTLAAGNIGPRLLKRFTTDWVNQITAGILGGTFLYAVISLIFVSAEFMPRITISVGVLLAAVSVVQLIYFVRHVARTISIDDEIAEISSRLTEALQSLVSAASRERKGRKKQDRDLERSSADVAAPRSGYIGVTDMKAVIDLATAHDLVVEFALPHGAFILKEQTLATVTGPLEEGDEEALLKLITIEPSRSEVAPVQFSIKLLVEVALRALSPGVNDSYTAVACVDSLTSAFATVADEGINMAVHRDREGNARVVLPGLGLKELVGSAFHPIRRAAGANILMAQSLAYSLARLHHAGGEEMRSIVENHLSLLFAQIRAADVFEDDIKSVVEMLPGELARVVEAGEEDATGEDDAAEDKDGDKSGQTPTA
ncbi:DUF2254 domain-containing protein [Rhodobium gokarnense]|uniref:Membrane protein n=1 Tax=Rhodobium gokarnense TaxID=364296 RepID=A0ABT3H891_9HYPH|nr:DUF2254 domain-containing protein [Rhodobium gokarnense]MCW2306615.1 putative membrane protein [Rhodobium gokarnense]